MTIAHVTASLAVVVNLISLIPKATNDVNGSDMDNILVTFSRIGKNNMITIGSNGQSKRFQI